MTNNHASQSNWYFYESFTYDQKLIDRAVRALSSDVTKDEIIEWITDEDEEIGFLAAANPILDLIDIERLAEVIPRESFKITGLGCNPNAPDWLVEELLALRHASAIIRVNKESKWKLDSKTPVSVSPGVRLVVGQQEEYANLLSEARSRNTESSRLLEIYQMKLMDIQDRRGDDSFGWEWYEDVNDSSYLFHSTQNDREVSGYNFDGPYVRMDPKLEEALSSRPLLNDVIRSLTIAENHLFFSYLCAEVVANPNAKFQLPPEDIDMMNHVLFASDQLRESLQPALFKWLELMLYESGSFDVSTIAWIHLIKIMRNQPSLRDAIDSLNCHSLINAGLSEEFDGFYEDEVTFLVHPQFLDMNELGGLHGVVERISPYLGGVETEVLREEFELESNCIKQAILLNPFCPDDIRERVSSSGSQLYVPTRLEMARFSAYAGFYDQVKHWLGSEVALEKLYAKCDEHVVKAVAAALSADS
jgi:hypothetical protein